MSDRFTPNGLPVLIGSIPLGDHEEAARLVKEYTPEIPIWAQLPVYVEEGMIAQFMPGLPGLVHEEDRSYIDSAGDSFSDELVRFYEEYMAVSQGETAIDASRFALKPDTAKGFFVLLDRLKTEKTLPRALKGHITGPVTFATAVKDGSGKAIYYDEQIREAAIKLLALKARWQVRQLTRYDLPVIIFLDEPALAGFGSSEFISISREEVAAALDEVIASVHEEGGLAGVHVCANTEWDLIMNTSVDIVNFDAYSFFDRFILYPEAIKTFLDRDGIIAWGIVPTGDAEHIEKETPESLTALWKRYMGKMGEIGFDYERLLKQSLITPSCGVGSLNPDHAEKVLALTREVSRMVRNGG